MGRPNQNWSYIFAPDLFDKSVDISQFQAQPLTAEDMGQKGINVSIIRQDLIERAMKVEQAVEDPSQKSDDYVNHLAKKLYRNVGGVEIKQKVELNKEMFQYQYQRQRRKKRKSSQFSIE